MQPKDKPNQVKAEPKGKQRAAGEKTAASDEGANWLKEAWRREAEGASEREAALASSEARCCFNSLGLGQ
jgi:hypothetical protein